MAEHLASIFGTEKDRVNCPFYFKIGVCRHGDRCSRLHNRPTASQTLLLANMYQSPDAGFHGGVDQHGNIQQSDPRKLQEHFEVCWSSLDLLMPCFFPPPRTSFFPFLVPCGECCTDLPCVFWWTSISYSKPVRVFVFDAIRWLWLLFSCNCIRASAVCRLRICYFVCWLWQDFYEDIFEELSKYGEIENLNVCDNLADHMVCSTLREIDFSLSFQRCYLACV